MVAPPSFVFVNKTAQSKFLTRSEGNERHRILSRVQQGHGPSRRRQGFVVLTVADMDQRFYPLNPSQDMDQTDLDPFKTYVVPLRRDMQEMLAYYYDTVIATTFPISCAAAAARPHIMEYAAEDQAVLHAILGLSNAAVFVKSHNGKFQRSAEYFKHQTLIDVQRCLSGKEAVAPTSAYAVALLLHLEYGQGNFEAAKVHSNGLVTLLKHVEKLESIPFSILNGIQACLYQSSAMTRTRPPVILPGNKKFGILPDQEAPIGCERLLSPSSHAITSRFANKAYQSFIGKELFGIISDLKILQLRRDRALQEDPRLSLQEFEAVHRASLSLEYRLLSMPFDSSLHPARDAVRLAVYTISGPRAAIFRTKNPFRSSLVGQLKSALEESGLDGLWKPYTDLLLWVLFAAAHVAYQQEEWRWVIRYVAVVLQELRIESLEDLEGNLAAFGVDVDRFERTVQDMWYAVQEMS